MNQMLKLARIDILIKKLTLVRWLVRAGLVVTLILHLVNQNGSTFALGIFFILLSWGIGLDLFRLFIRSLVGKEERRQQNVSRDGESVTFEVASLLVRSRGKPRHLWYVLLHDSSVVFVLQHLGVLPSQLYTQLTQIPAYPHWLEKAKLVAKNEQMALAPKHLFESIQGVAELQTVWDSMGVSEHDRLAVWDWWKRIDQDIKNEKRGLGILLSSAGGIGRDWASGYTNVLKVYSRNISSDIRHVGVQISLVGHRQERQQIVDYLSQDDHRNMILVGDEGIGKKRLIYSLAADFVNGKVAGNLRYKHIFELDTGGLIQGGETEEIENRLTQVLNEAEEAGNVVLVIPDFQLLVGAAPSKTLGIINAANVLSGYLQRPGIQIIGLLTRSDYHTYINPNPVLAPFLHKVEIREIGSAESLEVIAEIALQLEQKFKKIITYQALVAIIEVAERHVHDRPYPEKAINLLNEVMQSSLITSQTVTARDVEAVLSQKLNVPLGRVSNAESLALGNLEQLIKSRIIGQIEAVKSVANALRRARAGLTSGSRPIGSFLFLGPTGVGKTEMAKVIAQIYYQNPQAFIRLDMTEYQTSDSLDKLVGTKTQPGLLTTAVIDQPFSVILLDEIEKADASVRNLFLQVLDAGRVTDGYGKTVDFTNSMVIATSNAGAQLIRDAVEQNQIDSNFKARLLDFIQDQGIFAPEWLNRFDATVVFLPLTQAEILQVAHLQVADLAKQLLSHDIELTVADDVYGLLIEKGYDPEYGARPMRRAVQDLVENALAKVLLNQPGEGKKQINLTRSLLES